MADQDERREVRAIIRTYEKDGEKKNVYMTVGTAWVSEHGSKISLEIDAMPVSKAWNGKLYISKPYQPKDASDQRTEASEGFTPDTVAEVGDEPISLSDIPF